MQPSKIDTYTKFWIERNEWIAPYIPEESSILDIGCGNKSILQYVKCNDYLGLDRTEYADIKTDLDTETIEINKIYDVGLILGVLEYLTDPNNVISKYKDNAKTWIIVTKRSSLKSKIKYGWKQEIKFPLLKAILNKNFTNVKIIDSYDGYYLGLCSNEI